MRLTSKLLGQHFGQLAKVHGIVTYKLSPFEQRAFAGVISHGMANTFRRISINVLRVAPPFIIGYLIYDLTEKRHTEMLRKDPKEFENDK